MLGSKFGLTLIHPDPSQVTGASDKIIRQWDLTTGQCVLTMDILWAMSHPIPTAVGDPSATLDFSVTWDRPHGQSASEVDFVGGVQFWGYGLVSGSADGVVRMWDSQFFFTFHTTVES